MEPEATLSASGPDASISRRSAELSVGRVDLSVWLP